jgi:hypothetical protein
LAPFLVTVSSLIRTPNHAIVRIYEEAMEEMDGEEAVEVEAVEDQV